MKLFYRERFRRAKKEGKKSSHPFSQIHSPKPPKTGAMGSPPKIPGGATLIFETELLAINGKA